MVRRLGISTATLIGLLVLAAVPAATPAALAQAVHDVDPYRELLIVHPSVVDPLLNGGRSDNGGPTTPGGPWSLRYLLEYAMIHRPEAERQIFYATIFEQWLTSQVADSGVTVAPRNAALVKSLMLDQFSTLNADNTRSYQLWKLPFELIAIAYRPDLRVSSGANAGELRFVYKLIGPDGEDQKFSLIVEYKMPTTAYDPQVWAHNYHRLGELEVGSEEYLKLLQRLTWSVTTIIYSHLPELAQIRTNELAFAPTGGVWEMRELVPQAPAWQRRRMVSSSVENTPNAALFNGTQTLASFLTDFVAGNPALKQTGTAFMSLKLPETIQLSSGSTAFLDGSSHAGVSWSVGGASIGTLDSTERDRVLDNLGLLTCNGCHQDNKSASDVPFYHIVPDTSPGQDGTLRLSHFMTAADPDSVRAQSRPGELNRRKADFEQLLAQPWTPFWIDP